jgi:hypothetical protein
MPKTRELPERRIGVKVGRMFRDSRQMVADSPDSEDKEALKTRLINRQRVTIGDPEPRPRDQRKR